MTKVKGQMMLDRLAAAAREGSISRRSFMNYSMAAGLTATSPTRLCTTSAKAAPQRGGTWHMAPGAS